MSAYYVILLYLHSPLTHFRIAAREGHRPQWAGPSDLSEHSEDQPPLILPEPHLRGDFRLSN